ncbi:spore coat protein CotH [Neobacillus sp. PS3-40]|uniref:spore coat protein CotH n=1 Tax=Neobacillus sp. PS3-40 TaxID=3070679 RepID=UPI0027E0891B|nr:spore coat protein CotH [Neobacillus sp. PS3-40]WML44109.1 spore coat protein CotH [Neobacillus sp. PS3-40]
MEQSYHSFLMALKGKTVTIYKAGPESKKGKILDVKPDYIALHAENNNNNNNDQSKKDNNDNQNDQNTVVYYQVQHIKSVIEDTKTNSMQIMEEQAEVEYFRSENFISLMEQFVDQTIQINQGGPQSKHGILVAVFGDFLVLYTDDDGLVYFNIEHVKSVSKFNENKQNDENATNIPELQIPECVCVDLFQDVFKYFSHQWVSINRGGPDAMEGVLVENVGGHYTLVNNQEVMRIHPFHIQSISVGPKGHLKQNNNENNNENNDENKNQEQNEESSNECSSSSNESSSSSDESSSSSNESSSSSNGKRSSGKRRSSRKSSRRRSNRHRSCRENIVKSIDYTWKY